MNNIGIEKVQVGKNQRKMRNLKEIPTQTPRWEKIRQLATYTKKTYRKPSEQLFPEN